jgi:hypothetical protein
MAITVDIVGVPGVTQELRQAAIRYQSKAQTRRVLRPAAKALRDHLKNQVASTFAGSPRSTGTLRRSIRTFAFPRSRGLHVGPRLGGQGVRNLADGYYFGWQDQGTRRGIRAKFMIDKTMNKHGKEVANMAAQSLIDDLKYLT